MKPLPAHWQPHTVRIVPFLGEGGNGPVWGDPVEVPAFVEDVIEVVVDRSGSEVVSGTRVTLGFGDAPVEKSRVTVWIDTPHERTAPVVSVARNHHPRWPAYAVLRLK